MPAPIVAAYDPYVDDRAPVVLALAASELTGSPVIAACVHPWLVPEGYSAVDDFEREPEPVVTGALRRLHADLGSRRGSCTTCRCRTAFTSSRARRAPGWSWSARPIAER